MTWYSSWYLLVRHGGGDERIELFHRKVLGPVLDTLDSTARYWMLHAIYSAHSDGGKKARDKESHYWRTAAAEKRIKVRKIRGRDAMRVEVSA
ncbi:MAG: hypothetical protein EBS84_21340 [Proteobacteria bacterium]|nr:hypothetical protein [Pseudomonadota bacterium]